MFDTLYSVYRNQQKARQQAGLNQPFSTGLPEGIPNGNIPTQEQYNQRIAASANYANPVPMLPPEVGNIMSQGGYGSFGPSSLTAPPIAQEYQPVTEEVAVEEPQTLPNKEEVIGTVDTLAQQLRPSDNPSGASIHDEALKQINAILSSNDPQSKWQEQQDKPFWQRNDAYAGLIGVGLSLLSGASPIEAFQAGEGMRGAQARKDELANNKAYLLDRYSADSVAQALASGDASLLKEKGMSQKDQFALQQAQGDLDYARRKDFAQFQNDLKGEDPGSWASGGNGIIFNTRSGAVMNIGGQGAAGGTDAEAGQLEPFKNESGVWMVPSMNKGRQTGEYQVANSAQTKTLSEAEANQTESVATSQYRKDADILRKAADKGDVGTFTGSVASLDRGSDNQPGFITNLRTNVLGSQQESEAYQAAQRIEGYQRNQGINEARSMGASGINTAGEAELFFQGMPRINYSSKETLKSSLDNIDAYVNAYNNKKSRNGALSVQAGSSAPASSSGWSASIVN